MALELVSNFVLNVAFWLWLATALFLYLLARKIERARIFAAIFLVAFWISGTTIFARAVMAPLETKYLTPSLAQLQNAGVKRVVVLTGGGYPRWSELDALALPHASTFRFLSGFELCARLNDCEIIFSGSAGSSNPNIQAANTMQELAAILAPQLPVHSESNSSSTREHPQNVKTFVQTEPFVLVTSAYHMPRAMFVFESAGLTPIPYPVDFYTHAGFVWNDFVPSPQNWEILNLALHEYVGLATYAFAP